MARIPAPKQLDDGIGDTLVSGGAQMPSVRSAYPRLRFEQPEFNYRPQKQAHRAESGYPPDQH